MFRIPGACFSSSGGRNSRRSADTEKVMDEPTDAALWERAAAGETDAFGLLFERHVRSVYNYCFRRTGDWSQAEELTAIVFLEAWRRRRDIQLEREDALPWLLGVADPAHLRYLLELVEDVDRVALAQEDEERMAGAERERVPHGEVDKLGIVPRTSHEAWARRLAERDPEAQVRRTS